jgi:hypothetical protein
MFCKSFTFHLFENLLFRLPNMSSMFDASVPAAYLQNAKYVYFADAPSSPYGYVDYETYIGVCDYINMLTKNLNELGAKHYTTCGKLVTLRAEKEALRAEKEALCAENESLRAEKEALRADLKEKTSWHYLATMGEEAPAAPAPVVVEAPAAPAPVVVEAPAAPAPVVVEAPAAPAPVVVEAPAAPAPVVKPRTDQEFIFPAIRDFMAGKVNTIEPSTTPKPPNKKGKAALPAAVPEVPEVSAAQMAAAQAFLERDCAETAAGLGFGESAVERDRRLLLEAKRLKKEEHRKEAKANHDANLRALEKAKADAEEAEAKKTAAAAANAKKRVIFQSVSSYNEFLNKEIKTKTRMCSRGIHPNMESCSFNHACNVYMSIGAKKLFLCPMGGKCIYGHHICTSVTQNVQCSEDECRLWHNKDVECVGFNA